MNDNSIENRVTELKTADKLQAGKCMDKNYNSIKDDIDCKNFYDEIAEVYDDVVNRSNDGRSSSRPTVEIFTEYVKDKNAKILDLGAGTGIIGKLLKNIGYTNVDAHDGSQSMLDQAKKQNIYINYICELLLKHKMEKIDDNSYDGAITNGCFCPGHFNRHSLQTMGRPVKPGGYLVLSIRKSFLEEHPYFAGLEETMKSLADEGFWKITEKRWVDNFYDTTNFGAVFVLERL